MNSNLNHARLLLAEDDASMREVLAAGLSESGFDVVAVNSGDAAFLRLERGRFDLLLTDVQMPGLLSGVDLARHAQKLTPPLPVIFMTGCADLVKNSLQSRQLLIEKPFTFAHLLEGIDRLLH